MKFAVQQKWLHLTLIFFIWLCCALFVNPVGEFPLNDDWAYAKNVYHLSENCELIFNDWPAMTLIAHMLWGAMFTGIFGFSFTVLRISVLLLGIAGAWGFYLLILKMSRNNNLSLISSLALALNPLYFSLSNTFMTDVPFLAMIIWALYFYLSYFEKPQIKTMVLATLFVILATLIRQLGVWIAISFLITHLIFIRSTRSKVILITLISLVPLVILAIYPYWLTYVDSIPSHYSSVSDLFHSGTADWFLKNFFQRSGILLFSIGLFSIPVSLLIFPYVWKQLSSYQRFYGGILSFLFIIPVVINLKHVPAGNVFYNLGLGPKVLKDTYWNINNRPVLTDETQILFDVMGTAGTLLLVFVCFFGLVELFSKKRSAVIRSTKMLSLVILTGYLGFIMTGSYFFDRYFLTLFPFFILFVIPSQWLERRKMKVVGLITLLPYLLFSTAATRDYFSWNKARWAGLNELIESGIPPSAIDGGFEFNTWYETGQSIPAIPGFKSWWFVDKDDYAVGFGNICGYELHQTYKYFSFLTFRNDSIVILKKSEVLDSVRIYCDTEKSNVSGDIIFSSDTKIFFTHGWTRTDQFFRSGKYSVRLNKENPYGLGTIFEDVKPCEEWRITVWCKNPHKTTRLVVSVPGAKSYYWTSKFDNEEKNGWILGEIKFIIPQNFPSNSLQIYLWNPDVEFAYFDDISISRYIR